MAFGAAELRVLRRALALALHPGQSSAEDVQDCHRLAESLDEAMHEGARLRAFLVADLARYRAALPGTAAGYLTLLEEAMRAGHRPHPDDLAALRALRGNPRAAALLDDRQAAAPLTARIPASRSHLHALPGGLANPASALAPHADAEDPAATPERKPEKQPTEKPAPPSPAAPGSTPKPARRPVPTPGEVFPRRKPPQPPATPSQRLAAV